MKNRMVLITGAGGFIGKSLIRRALRLGYEVRGLELDPKKVLELENEFPIEVIQGSIADKEIRSLALKRISVVINTAAVMKESGSLDEFRKINVEATYQLADEAKKSGVRIFVQLSSVMVYGFHFPPYVTEDGPLDGTGSSYAQTKIEGEHALLPLNQPPKFGMIILRPGDVYGPGSLPWVIRPLRVMDKGMFALPSGGTGIINLNYVDNLSQAVFIAIENKVFGTPINITDGYAITWKEYFTELARISGRPEPKSMPYLLAKGMVGFLSPLIRIIQGESVLSPEGIDFIMRPHPVSTERAKKFLQWKPEVNYQEGMRRTQEWILQNKI